MNTPNLILPSFSDHRLPSGYYSTDFPVSQVHNNLIRVLVVDDHPMMRQGLADLFRREQHIEVVGFAEDGAAALALTYALRPDIVLMDLAMPGMDGLEATTRIKEMNPTAGVVALTAYSESEQCTAAFAAGVDAYLTKDALPEKVVSTVLEVAKAKAFRN